MKENLNISNPWMPVLETVGGLTYIIAYLVQEGVTYQPICILLKLLSFNDRKYS